MQRETNRRVSKPVELHARTLPGAASTSHREAALLRDQLPFDRQAEPDRDHFERNAAKSNAAARSRCAQKVRIALAEKGQQVQDHIMTLRGDQYEPAYLKLNPNGVVPTLVHDGVPITESALILYYIDDAFPEPPL